MAPRTTATAAQRKARAPRIPLDPRRKRPQTGPVPMLGCDVPTDYASQAQLAMALSRSTIVPPVLHGSPENCLAIMLVAQALQLPLAVTWQNVYLAREGELGQRSRLLHMLLRRAGHRLVFLDCDDQAARALLWIHGASAPVEVAYMIDEAVQLGLTEEWRDRDRHWQRQPAQMLKNRAISRAVRDHCPEVMGGTDWSEEGGLVVAGLAVGDEPVTLSGLGPEVVRLLDQLRAIEEDQALDPTGRVTALRGVWAEARLILDQVVDDHGTTMAGLISGRLATAKVAQMETPEQEASGQVKAKAKRKGKSDEDEQIPITLVCGCPALEVTTKGAHREGCSTIEAQRAQGAQL